MSTAALCILSNFVGADRLCDIAQFPGCSAPFPPGHKNMGDAWWGIGSKESGAIIKSVATILLVNEVPRTSEGVMVAWLLFILVTRVYRDLKTKFCV